MNIFFIISFVLIIAGICFDFAYSKRRRKIFDGKCNDLYILSRALSITGVTLLFVGVVSAVFHLI